MLRLVWVFFLAMAAACWAGPARPLVEFTVEGKGRFVIEVRPDQAPLLSAHFMGLVDKGFYDNLLFHRKVENFVIQAGDPKTKGLAPAAARAKPGPMGGTQGYGSGGSGKEVPFEINDLVHGRHWVGMALSAPMSDTGDSQFFINLRDNFRLNGMYVVFAQVVRGNDVIGRVERGDRIVRARRIGS